MKVSKRVSELGTQTVGSTLRWSQFTKGHNSVKTYGTDSPHRLMMLYICIKFQEIISKGFRVIERLRFVY